MERNSLFTRYKSVLETLVVALFFLSLLFMQYQIWLAPGSISDNVAIKNKIEHNIFSNMQKQQENERLNNKIQIGYPQKGGTQQVLINAGVVDVKTKGGNIGDILKTSSLFAAFAKSYVPGGSLASAAAGMYGSGGFSLGSLAKTAATAYGGPVAGMAAEAAVNELTS